MGKREDNNDVFSGHYRCCCSTTECRPTGTPTTRANSSKVGDNLVIIWQDGVGQISFQLSNNLTIMLKIIGNKLGK